MEEQVLLEALPGLLEARQRLMLTLRLRDLLIYTLGLRTMASTSRPLRHASSSRTDIGS